MDTSVFKLYVFNVVRYIEIINVCHGKGNLYCKNKYKIYNHYTNNNNNDNDNNNNQELMY